MKRIAFAILIITTMTMFSGCDVTKGLQSAYNMKNCDYKYNSISNLSVSNMNLSNGISVINVAKLLAIFNGSASSIPLDFTLNLDVHNPNSTQAAFQALQYIIQIDDIEFSTGRFTQAFNVNSGETKRLPIQVGTDLGKLITDHSKTKILNIAKNFIGLSDEKSNVTIQLKPTFNIRGTQVTSPVYIPVTFTFGGK